MENIKVVSTEPQLDLFLELKKKHYEIRSKRDAVSLIHQQLNGENNKYNKIIICMSLLCSFVETLKLKLELTDKQKWGYAVSNGSSIAPIFLSTCIAIISSLIKFKRYNETLELLTTSLIKLNSVLSKMRKLEQDLHFIPLDDAKKTYQSVILSDYRIALIDIESSVYPNIRQKWFLKAQQNIIRQLKIDTKYNDKVKKILHLAPDIDVDSSITETPDTPINVNIKTDDF